MKKQLFPAVMALVFAVFAASCSDNNDGPARDTYLQFATLNSVNDNGSSFTVINSVDSPDRILTSTQKINTDKIHPGDRMMIYYALGNGTTSESSGPIDLYAYSECINGKVVAGKASDNDSWKTGPLQNVSMMITGKWLNIECTGVILRDPKKFALIADESTLDSRIPVVYLVYLSDDDIEGTYKKMYASFDISLVWGTMRYDGFTIRLNNETGDDSYTFRQTNTITPMQ